MTVAAEPRVRAGSALIADWAFLTFGTRVAPATIRSWAHRGHIARHVNRSGQVEYDLYEVQAYLEGAAWHRQGRSVEIDPNGTA